MSTLVDPKHTGHNIGVAVCDDMWSRYERCAGASARKIARLKRTLRSAMKSQAKGAALAWCRKQGVLLDRGDCK